MDVSLLTLLSKLEPYTLLWVLPTLGCAFLGYFIISSRREDRQDRRAMLEALDRVTAALTGVQLELARRAARRG
jgi:hypothetical protein